MKVCLGELSLDGKLQKVRGILPIMIGAEECNIKRLFLPYDNISEGYIYRWYRYYTRKEFKSLHRSLNGSFSVFYVKSLLLRILI